MTMMITFVPANQAYFSFPNIFKELPVLGINIYDENDEDKITVMMMTVQIISTKKCVNVSISNSLQNSKISCLRLSKKLLHTFCVWLKVLVPSVSIALAEIVLSGQAVQMHNPQIAQLHKLCMLIFKK